jgi:hypothetical protein
MVVGPVRDRLLDKANDLVALSSVLSHAWSTIQNMTAIQWSQVERAATLGPEVTVALGHRTGFSATPTEAKIVRAKAVSLFLTAVDQTERALTYLRWTQDDVRAFLLSPYSGGRSGARSAPRADDLPTPPPTPRHRRRRGRRHAGAGGRRLHRRRLIDAGLKRRRFPRLG